MGPSNQNASENNNDSNNEHTTSPTPSSPGYTSYNNPSVQTVVSTIDELAPEPANDKKKNYKKYIAFGLLIFSIFAVIAGALVFINRSQENSQAIPKGSVEPKNNLGFRLLVPNNLNWERPQLIKEALLFSYSNNVQYGKGIVKGSYGFYVYPKEGSSFEPPNNCGLPGRESSTIVPCEEYSNSNDIKAYTINDQAYPGSIQNTSVKSYITMYAEIDGTVLVITSADTDASNLYKIISDMKEISIDDLPKSSVL